MTRFVVVAAAFLAFVSLSTEEANALTSKTRLCISRERRTYRDTLRTLRAQALSDFQTRYKGCFGPGADCAAACQAIQDGCLKTPRDTQQSCVDDKGASPTESCNEKFDKKLDECQGLADDAAALSCATQARLDRFACTQDCALAAQPAVDACNADFSDCVQSCASAR